MLVRNILRPWSRGTESNSIVEHGCCLRTCRNVYCRFRFILTAPNYLPQTTHEGAARFALKPDSVRLAGSCVEAVIMREAGTVQVIPQKSELITFHKRIARWLRDRTLDLANESVPSSCKCNHSLLSFLYEERILNLL